MRAAQHGYLVLLPQFPELLAHRREVADQGVELRVVRAPGVGGAQVRHVAGHDLRAVLGRYQRPVLGAGEGEPVDVPRPPRPDRPPEERLGHRVAREHLPDVADDLRRGVNQPVEHEQEPGTHVRGWCHPVPGRVPGEPVQVVALVVGQPQRSRERSHDLRRGMCAAGLLETCVVIHRDARLLGHVIAPQSGGARAVARREPEGTGIKPLSAAPQEVGERRAIGLAHATHSRPGQRG